MNTKEIIESGILEAYALGLTTPGEQNTIREMVGANEQLAGHLVDTENNIQSYFAKSAVPPPTAVREILLLRDPETNVVKPKHVFNKNRQEQQPAGDKYLDIEVNDTYIKVHKYWRPAFIAVFVLSKIFLIGGLYFYFKSTSLQQEVEKLKTEIKL